MVQKHYPLYFNEAGERLHKVDGDQGKCERRMTLRCRDLAMKVYLVIGCYDSGKTQWIDEIFVTPLYFQPITCSMPGAFSPTVPRLQDKRRTPASVHQSRCR